MSDSKPDQHPQQQGGRDTHGMLQPGHEVGATTRWQPGQSGNPGGTPIGSAKPGRWLQTLAEATDDDLRTIVDDARASCSKKAAAQSWLDTRHSDPNVRRNAFRVTCDRIEGKPTVAVRLEDPLSPQDIETRLVALMSANPRIFAFIAHRAPHLVDQFRQSGSPRQLPLVDQAGGAEGG